MSTAYLTNAAQDEREIAAFCALLAAEGVGSYLEIGAKYGGSLWRVATALPAGSRIVAVDMPNGTRDWKATSASLIACIDELNRRGYAAQVIWGDSTDPMVIKHVRSLGPFDACLIDADHRLPGVTQDWNNYGPMAKVVAFHDLAWKRPSDWAGVRIDVPEFWASIKGDFARTQEIIRDPAGKDNGIGVLWRA